MKLTNVDSYQELLHNIVTSALIEEALTQRRERAHHMYVLILAVIHMLYVLNASISILNILNYLYIQK